ncbi:MAG: hypothetical protein BWY36_00207 [Candidatus Diapherotrites archaeon ADurb.Bin253]|jgi:hypothetical protein|nr:MAG: hypothetical protein BWY36_00207 [Candidatus Diapherotrites archaeon ADurb.Bin253]HOH03844.1 hypothetical protein [Candidatus Pacearchaeota archaeon]
MNTQKENKNLEEKVDDIIKTTSLRNKLKSIENQRKEVKLEDINNILQRYNTIVDYFVENRDRVESNRTYLVEVMYGLSKCIVPVVYGDSQLKEKDSNFILIKKLSNEIKDMLNIKSEYKSGTGTGVGGSI